MDKPLYKFIESISPSELSQLRNKQQENSTRDKAALLNKVKEVEDILEKLNKSIELTEIR